MRGKMIQSALLLVLLLSGCSPVRALDGRLFVISFMHLAKNDNDPGFQEVIINGMEETNIRMEFPDPMPTQYYTLDSTNNYQRNFSFTTDLSVSASESAAEVGVMVSSDKNISISATKSHAGTTGAYLAIPVTANAKEFFIPAWPTANNQPTAFTLVSLAKDTCAEIYHVDGDTFTRYKSLHLKRLQVHQMLMENTGDDFTGYYVNATRPLAVNGGHVCAFIPEATTQYCDHIVEQVPPLNEWGSNFMMVNPVGRTKEAGYDFRVIAGNKGITEVQVDDIGQGTTQNFNITRGNFITQSVGFGNSSASVALVTCNQPCLVVQYNRGFETNPGSEPDETDPFMAIVPSLMHWPSDVKLGTNRYYRLSTNAPEEGYNYLLIFIHNNYKSGLKVNGNTIPSDQWTSVGGWASDYSWYASGRIAQGHHTVMHDDDNARFAVFAHGHGSVHDEHTAWAYLGGYKIYDEEWAGDWYNISFYNPNGNSAVQTEAPPVIPGLGLDIDFIQRARDSTDIPYYEVEWIARFYAKSRDGKFTRRKCSEGYGRYVFDREISVLLDALNNEGGLIDVNCQPQGIKATSNGLGYYTEYTRGQVTLKLVLYGTPDHTLSQVKQCGGRIKTVLQDYRGWGGTLELGDESLVVPDADFNTDDCDEAFFEPDHFVELREGWLCSDVVTEVHFSSGCGRNSRVDIFMLLILVFVSLMTFK